MTTRTTKPTNEATIENRGVIAENIGSVNAAGLARDHLGDTLPELGIRIGTPSPDEDAANTRAVMDAIETLFTDNEERTSSRTGEVYVANKREFPGKMMLRQFVRQFDFDLKGLKERVATEEAKLARELRKLNADERELRRIEENIERMLDSFCERTAMRRVAAAYFADLTGERFDDVAPAREVASKAAAPSDYDKRRADRAKLLGL